MGIFNPDGGSQNLITGWFIFPQNIHKRHKVLIPKSNMIWKLKCIYEMRAKNLPPNKNIKPEKPEFIEKDELNGGGGRSWVTRHKITEQKVKEFDESFSHRRLVGALLLEKPKTFKSWNLSCGECKKTIKTEQQNLDYYKHKRKLIE